MLWVSFISVAELLSDFSLPPSTHPLHTSLALCFICPTWTLWMSFCLELSLYSQYFITVVTHPSVLCHSLFFMLALCPPESLVGQDYLLDGPLLSLPTTGGLILASSPSSLPAPSMDQFTTTALSSGQSHQGKNRMHIHLSCMSYMQRAIDCKVWFLFLFFTNSTFWCEKFL